MDPPTSDVPKLPDMVMCGDHPSFTKTELNAKEPRPEERDKPRDKPVPYARLSPTASRTERTASEHGLRALAARRRVRSLEAVPRAQAHADRALVQAALGSFRWPPYLLCVWVCVLALTHALHGLAALLDRALPGFRKLCEYFRAWTEEAWRSEREHYARALGLAAVTGVLYALCGALYAARALAAWAVEPLAGDELERGLAVTEYEPLPSTSNTNANLKHQ